MSAKSRSSHFRAKFSQYLLQQSKGFTLIELLVVVVIVGILSAVAIPTFLNQVRRARVAEAQSGLTEVQRASEVYRLDVGLYPNSYAVIASQADAQATSNGSTAVNGTLYLNDPWTTKAPNYKLPTDSAWDGSKGVLWTTIADTAGTENLNLIDAGTKAAAYKNGNASPLECVVGLGTEVDNGNLDDGCNLK